MFKRRKETRKNTCTSFFCYRPQIMKITNIFKHTNIGISLRNTNTFQQHTKPKTQHQATENDESGDYKFTCNACHRSYVRQTNHTQRLRFHEHTKYIKTN